MSARLSRVQMERLERWFSGQPGAFAFSQQRRLVGRLSMIWSRREGRLLDIGCRNGHFLEAFWESGFDVDGVDAEPELLARARTCIGERADCNVGSPEHLGFADGEYEYATVLQVLDLCENPEAIIKEALRVAKLGVIIGFWNTWSLTQTLRRCRGAEAEYLSEIRWYNPLEMTRMVEKLANRKISRKAAVLPGPACTWRRDRPFGRVNRRVYPFPLGAYCAIRVDFLDDKLVTPLMSFSTSPCGGSV